MSSSASSAESMSATTLPVRLVRVSQRFGEHGTLFQKWHRSDVSTGAMRHGNMPLSPVEARRYRLVKCFDQGPLGMRFGLLGSWLKDLPKRLDTSVALDDAVSLLSNIHERMLNSPTIDPAMEWVRPSAYGKALSSLKNALGDPQEAYKVETLAASMLLLIIEDKFGSLSGFSVLHHAGGVTKLLQVRGPQTLKNDFEWNLVASIRGPVLSQSVITGVSCYLTEPRWKYLEEFTPSTQAGCILQELLTQVTQWPGWVARMRRLHTGSLPSGEVDELRADMTRVERRLRPLFIVITEAMEESVHVTTIPSANPDYNIGVAYDFKEDGWAALINMYVGFALVLDNMINYLNDTVSNGNATDVCDAGFPNVMSIPRAPPWIEIWTLSSRCREENQTITGLPHTPTLNKAVGVGAVVNEIMAVAMNKAMTAAMNKAIGTSVKKALGS
ncbi:hypothetical protein K491DRAFT_711029 [Lophiostoma macrostomum CBS 122681]|uniref:Uncharacterized protein n=1 Tax=Lophiostoma macrostomum CBS 122681 TaxID=1314788 RepID=A0A6A6TM30_9PLEO|nr:hypothetical protein K491DRAFT_711029 [Lophiostoma macrostomum CBS 122681]